MKIDALETVEETNLEATAIWNSFVKSDANAIDHLAPSTVGLSPLKRAGRKLGTSDPALTQTKMIEFVGGEPGQQLADQFA